MSPAGQGAQRPAPLRPAGAGGGPGGGVDALGLADAADIGRDAAIAACVPTCLDLLKKLDGGVAPGVPALQEIRLIGIDDTSPIVAPVLPAGPGRHLEIPLDRATTAANLRRDGHSAPALPVQGPHLLIDGLSARGALGRAGLLGWGCGRWAPGPHGSHRAAARVAGAPSR